jgi:hypothetical protein
VSPFDRLQTVTHSISLLEWLLTGSVTQLVLAIIARDTRVTLERWVFDITVNEAPVEGGAAYVVKSLYFTLFWYLKTHQLKPQTRGRVPVRNPPHPQTNCLKRDIPAKL